MSMEIVSLVYGSIRLDILFFFGKNHEGEFMPGYSSDGRVFDFYYEGHEFDPSWRRILFSGI